jgi:proline iminopeptidase
VLLVLPGGPGADFRLLRPLLALANDHFVVLWDQHGCGLSQRMNRASELALDSFDEEIEAVRQHYAGDRKVTLIGHSFGGSIATAYAARHPQQVAALVLFEPGPLTVDAREHRGTRTWLSASTVQRVFWGNEVLSAQDHAQADYRLLGVMREATVGFNCPGVEPPEVPMWRFGAFAYEMVLSAEHDMDYARGIDQFTGPVLMLVGTCSDLSADFQRRYNAPVFDQVQIEQLDGASHSDLFLQHAARSVELVRTFLAEQVRP